MPLERLKIVQDAYDAAWKVVSESGSKAKQTAFDNWLTKELETDYDMLSTGDKMAANVEYARKRLTAKVQSAQQKAETKLTDAPVTEKTRTVDDFLNKKDQDKIYAAVEDVQRLEKEGFSREQIQERVDQVVDNAVKRKLIEKIKKESAVKDIAKDEKNKWKGINTIRWQNFNKVL